MAFNWKQMIFFIVIFVVLPLSGCGSTSNAQSDTAKPVDSIARELNRFQQALLSRDTVAIKEIYAENAASLLQNQPVRIGRDAIIQRWKKSSANPISVRIIPQDVNLSPSGQDAFQFGAFEIHSTDTTNALLASGKLMFLWRREPDRWRIALEMDNFDSARPPQSISNPKQ
jgi:ketosteroid isomerase-like protein